MATAAWRRTYLALIKDGDKRVTVVDGEAGALLRHVFLGRRRNPRQHGVGGAAGGRKRLEIAAALGEAKRAYFRRSGYRRPLGRKWHVTSQRVREGTHVSITGMLMDAIRSASSGEVKFVPGDALTGHETSPCPGRIRRRISITIGNLTAR